MNIARAREQTARRRPTGYEREYSIRHTALQPVTYNIQRSSDTHTTIRIQRTSDTSLNITFERLLYVADSKYKI